MGLLNVWGPTPCPPILGGPGNSKFSGCNVIDGLMMISPTCFPLRSLCYSTDQPARNCFLAGLTDSILKSDLLSSEISSTVVLNALDQLKKGKSDGLSLF